MITVNDVAKYFLTTDDDESDISNMKLQKLVYYAQAFHLALFDKPFFNEEFEAWIHGPVCPALYREYKQYGSSFIPKPIEPVNLSLFSTEQIELLNEIQEVFGQFSAVKLRNLTHEELPWQEKESTAGVIEKSSMMAFYKTRLK